MLYMNFVHNLALLVALCAIAGYVVSRWRLAGYVPWVQGVSFGTAAAAAIMTALQLAPGIIFDGRSVVLSLCGLLFGPLPALLAGIIAVAARLALGGSGALTGILVISASVSIGIATRQFFLRKRREPSTGLLLGLGFVVHAAMLALMLTLPNGTGQDIIRQIALPVLLTYPLATVLIGRILSDQRALRYSIKLAEQQRNELATTLYSIGDAVVTTDAAGRVKRMNAIAEKLTGWYEAEACGRAASEVLNFVDEHSRKTTENPIYKSLRGEGVVELSSDSVLVSRDGSERPISDSAAPIKTVGGKIDGIVLVFRDQTEKRGRQESLRLSEARFRLLVESAPDAIFVQTEQKFRFVNNACLKLFGAESPGQLLGTPVLERFHPDIRAQVQQRIATLNEKREAVGLLEEMLLRLDGREAPAEVAAVPIQYEGKDGAMVFARDISQRRAAEAALRDQELRHLRQRNALMDFANSDFLDTAAIGGVFEQITRIASETLSVGRAGIWLYSEGQQTLECACLYESSKGAYSNGMALGLADYPAYFQSLKNKIVVAASQARTDAATSEFRDSYLIPLGITSMLDAPIFVQGDAVGVIRRFKV